MHLRLFVGIVTGGNIIKWCAYCTCLLSLMLNDVTLLALNGIGWGYLHQRNHEVLRISIPPPAPPQKNCLLDI